jgi:sporulation protein YlmC with PRC-barrel domain
MEISAKHLNRTKVYDSQGRLLCHLRQAIIDPNNGQILGFTTNRRSPFGAPAAKLISPQDVIKWEKDTLILGHQYEFYQTTDLVRMNRMLKNRKSKILGKNVRTENGQKLGRVTDYALNQNLKILASITCHKKFLRLFYYDRRLIRQKNIVEITPREIIVKDSTVKLPVTNLVQSTPDKFSLQNSPTFDRA